MSDFDIRRTATTRKITVYKPTKGNQKGPQMALVKGNGIWGNGVQTKNVPCP
jgi:hypothetical protein